MDGFTTCPEGRHGTRLAAHLHQHPFSRQDCDRHFLGSVLAIEEGVALHQFSGNVVLLVFCTTEST